MIIDTHCHLTDEKLKQNATNIISNLYDNNIESVICVGYDFQSSIESYNLSIEHENVYCSLGIHPHDSESATLDNYKEFEEKSKFEKVVAIGEIGLDYYYNLSPKEIQKKEFVKQLELAHSVNLPVILHIRDAYEDARKLLFDNKHYLTNGLILHCYSGSVEFIKIFNKLDAYYSFGGAITFKNAKRNLDALCEVPTRRLVFETDSPYMAPTPYRGKINEPKFINNVIDKAAQVLNMEREMLIELSTENAKELFHKIK